MKWYEAAADQGCTKSLCNLGVMYIKGAENIPKNDVLAVKYLKKAVDGGDSTAALNLGKMCEVGRAGHKIGGESQDKRNAAALNYIQIAASGGHPGAQTKLGDCYSYGKYGLEEGNWKEARKWYRTAARNGYNEACIKLGNMYVNGEGVPTNAKVAAKHYRVAAEKNDVEGMYLLGRTLCDGGGKLFFSNTFLICFTGTM